jgi:putative membrane protein
MKNVILAGVVALAMPAVPALAKTAPADKPAKADEQFVMSAARANLAEVELGKIGETKASNAEVKRFAKRMVDDHSKALDELKTVASKADITLPTAPDRRDLSLKSRLDKLTGGAFDRAYMRAMVKDHRHDVAAFRVEKMHAKDANVKQYAASTLPVLEEHLKLAENADKAVTARH